MKTILCLLGFLTVVSSCKQKEASGPINHATAVTLVVDPTDRREEWPTANPLLLLFNCEPHPEAACEFRLAAITDKRLNRSYNSRLPDASVGEDRNLDDDPQYRNRQILTFYASVRKNVADAYQYFDTTNAMEYSECWRTISDAIRELMQSTCVNKYLINASDLMERSDILDAYREARGGAVLAIANKLDAAEQLPSDLRGITIFFTYQPKTRTEDTRFAIMLAAYKKILEKRGAKIKVQATNAVYEP
jgi:hypothetical protein